MEVHAEGQLAHFNLGLAFRQKGYYGEALREYAKALERGEDRRLVLQAMAEVHLLRREPKAAVELYDELLANAAGQPEAVERARRRAAPGRHSPRRRRAIGAPCSAEPAYALAHNNLGVALYHAATPTRRSRHSATRSTAQPTFTKARLNLALLLSKGKRFQLALEAYRSVLQREPEHPVGVERRRARARRSCAGSRMRATRSRARSRRSPDFAEAHYNLSFTLSNLGDFEGALRETKRALELDPFYVAQKFALAIDLEYEDPDLSIQPDLGAVRAPTEQRRGLRVRRRRARLALHRARAGAAAGATCAAARDGRDRYAMATDYLAMGLYDRAAAEVSRALSRGGAARRRLLRCSATSMRGRGCTAKRSSGTAKRSARPEALRPHDRRGVGAAGDGTRARGAADRRSAARGVAADVDMLMLVAAARAERAIPAAALRRSSEARRLAPQRADVHQQIGDIARSLGDNEGAISAYRHALELDPDFAVVRFQLARLLRAKGRCARRSRSSGRARRRADLRRSDARAGVAAPPAGQRRRGAGPAHRRCSSAIPTTSTRCSRSARRCSRSGAKRDALHAFKRILRFDPSHVGALFHEGALFASSTAIATPSTVGNGSSRSPAA